MAGIWGCQEDQKVKITSWIGIFKKISLVDSSHKSKYFKASKLGQEIHETDFSKVIYTDEYRVTYDGPDWWAKGWILSNLNMLVVKIRQIETDCVMIWAKILHQTIIGPFKVDQKVRLNSSNYGDFMDKTFFSW